jgi:hypothetical protein
MVAFHDRRESNYTSVEDVREGVDLQPTDTLSKNMIDGRFFVRGALNEEGRREFVLHEALPNGRVIERGRYDRRYKANSQAQDLAPTSIYDV